MSAQNADVFIVGGGPAGLAAGIAAAERGLGVTVADSAHPPIDKACGEGIMPDGLRALGALGVDLTGVAGAPFAGIRFVDAAGEISARFPQGDGYGMRRSALHRVLTARAESVGVRLAWGTRVEAVRQGEVVAGGKTIRSTYVVCADGQNSSLRQMVGLGAGKVYRRRYGFRSRYQMRPWSPFVEVHWADCGQVYVTPVGAEEVCVVLITSDQHLRLEAALGWFPELQEQAGGADAQQQADGRGHGDAQAEGCHPRPGGAAGRLVRLGRCDYRRRPEYGIPAGHGAGGGDVCRRPERVSAAARRDQPIAAQHGRADADHGRAIRGCGRGSSGDSHGRPRCLRSCWGIHTRTISPLQLGVRDCLEFGWSVLRA